MLTNLLADCTLLVPVITLSKISSIPEELWVLPQQAKGVMDIRKCCQNIKFTVNFGEIYKYTLNHSILENTL